jgi:hypothetical protein
MGPLPDTLRAIAGRSILQCEEIEGRDHSTLILQERSHR